MESSILVTGAAGFIGSHLCEHLLQQGFNVVGIDNFDPFYDRWIKEANLQAVKDTAIRHNQFVFHDLSINDRDGLTSQLSRYPIDTVIHLAAKAGVRPSILDPVGYSHTNIDGTISVLEFCRASDIRNLIFASSSSVYGNNEKVPFSESDFVDNPISPYASSKKAGELLCHTYSHLYSINTACLRFFTVYGPRQRPDLAIHKFTRLIADDQPIPMFGDGSTRRDYTYIDDIIDGIVKTLKWVRSQTEQPRYEVFNLGESNTVELRYLIDLIERALGKKAVIEHQPMQPGDVLVTYADVAKAREVLGYDPKTSIELGIPRFVDWFLRQRRDLSAA